MVASLQSRAAPSIQQVFPTFKALVPAEEVRSLARMSSRRFYDRIFNPLVIVWCFIFQRLNADHSLDAVLGQVSSGAMDHLDDRHPAPISERIRSESTAAYAKARKRLPLAVLVDVAQRLAQAAERCLENRTPWHGHPVALLDGTTVRLRPQPELVSRYGQARNQHGIAYWVVVRLLAAFCLHTGSLLTVADGSQRESEQTLAKSVLAQLAPNTVCIGDSNFGVFSVAQAARHYNLFTLLRLTASRAKRLATHKLSPGHDLTVEWVPTKHDQPDPSMSRLPITARLIYVRLQPPGFRPLDLYLLTTLLDPSLYPVDELVSLYHFRWQVELRLRDVKTFLDMEFLTAKSVAMLRKELWAGLAAYNLVRACMAMAAHEAGLSPTTLSFSKCYHRVQAALRSVHRPDTPLNSIEPTHRLLRSLAKCILQKRDPFRVEPRAVRKRRVGYPPLKGPRDKARQLTLRRLIVGPSKC